VRKRIVCKVAFVVTTLAAVIPAHAAEITDKTPCSVMDTMDIDHVQRGEPGIMSQMSESGKTNLFAVTSVQCRNHPSMTVYNSAALIYRGTRDIEIQFGAAK
jgi:hypothetical protein